jgi:hypothetical protein
VYIGFIVFIEKASPFRVHRLKPWSAALCLTTVISIVSSGAAAVAPVLPKRGIR